MNKWFTKNPFRASRVHTNSIKIGNLLIGSKYPVRIQSMANTPTSDIQSSVQQAIDIINAGGELVRFTVVNEKDARALQLIKEELVNRNYHTPLVADIHFNPKLADIAAKYVDKVRINPGNYLEKRASFIEVNLSDEAYNQELEKLYLRFSNFLSICKAHQTAIRIGTNHGSLSDRIMTRYGDTPKGMVEATMEFLRICKKENFDNVVVSLKASNTRVMVQAYRLLSLQMQEEEMNYNLHLGVTEAGNAEDGRIKSAAGIGTLMNDGLGDTIRVSLTENPTHEIPVGKKLALHFEKLTKTKIDFNETICFNPYKFDKRETNNLLEKNVPIVIADMSGEHDITKQTLETLGFSFDENKKTIERGQLSPDYIYSGEHIFPFIKPVNTCIITDCKVWNENSMAFPLFSFHDYLTAKTRSNKQNWVLIEYSQLDKNTIEQIKNDPSLVLVATSHHSYPTAELRMLVNKLMQNDCKSPIVVMRSYNEIDFSDFQLKSAADNALFFIDGLVEGIWLKNTFKKSVSELSETAFSILQATRSRTTKTEYIACPGCGRTLFDLEQTLAEVKQNTDHLKGLKIAVMGCLVNGPGEMADADYGYVGFGTGKIALYKGKELVKRNIDAKNAVNELLTLIETEKSKEKKE